MRSAVLLFSMALFAACGGGGGSGSGPHLLLTRDAGIVERALHPGAEPTLSTNDPGIGGEERVLIPTPNDAILLDPAVSPDGRLVAYTQQLTRPVLPNQPTDYGTDVYIANRDGTNPRLFVSHSQRGELAGAPFWLPSGDAILVSIQGFSGARVIASINRVDLATGAPAKILDDAIQPGVSPDGTQIVYVKIAPDYSQTLWIANIDGSEARQLAGGPDGFVSFNSPRFGPDGHTIVYGAASIASARGTPRGVPALVSLAPFAAPAQTSANANGLPMDIWLLDLDAGTPPQMLANLDLDNPDIAWMPDGKTLFVLGGAGLYEIDIAASTANRIGEGYFHGQLDWTPN